MKKVLVIGDSNTGKTSLVNRAVNNTFEPVYKATVACEFGTKILEINGESIQLQLWDLAGQDRLTSSMSKIYARDAVGAIIVCDLTDKNSMEMTAEWKKKLGEHCAGIPMWLCGNKSDLNGQVSAEELEQFREQHEFFGCSSTSAKTGDNVEDMLLKFARIIVTGDGAPNREERGMSLYDKKDVKEKKKGCC